MTDTSRLHALTKLAFYGPAPVAGVPSFTYPSPTVGQMMYNANYMLPSSQARQVNNVIVNTGANVNAPAKSLLGAGIGALAGNFIATALNVGPFARGLITATGANYGYNS